MGDNTEQGGSAVELWITQLLMKDRLGFRDTTTVSGIHNVDNGIYTAVKGRSAEWATWCGSEPRRCIPILPCL